jgi:K+-transporting ATPase A subunit
MISQKVWDLVNRCKDRHTASTSVENSLGKANMKDASSHMEMLKYIHDLLNHNASRSLPKYALLIKQQEENVVS